MLEMNILRSDQDRIKTALKKRNLTPETLAQIDEIIALDDSRKATQTRLDKLLAEANQKSREIGQLFRQGETEKANVLRNEVNDHKGEIKDLEDNLKQVKESLSQMLFEIPNVPHELVVQGKGEEENVVVRDWNGDLPSFSGFSPLPHWDLADKYQLIDFGLGAKITGSGFPLFRGKGARLERALINFFLAEAEKAGYEEIIPPLLVNPDTARATGQLPDKEGQMYYVEKDDLYLIPTAEVPVTNMLRDETVSLEELPVKLTGYTPCFRREAGSYGSDVKGLNRVHQFDKVEIVQVAHPDHSYQILDEMVAHVESLLDKLELPFRILRLCGGDLGFTSAMTYDFEVFSAAQEKWLEVSSVSNFETYQSNRLNLKYRDGKSKPALVHTLNGSALALARIMAAILENNQDGSGINIPWALHSYTGFERID